MRIGTERKDEKTIKLPEVSREEGKGGQIILWCNELIKLYTRARSACVIKRRNEMRLGPILRTHGLRRCSRSETVRETFDNKILIKKKVD